MCGIAGFAGQGSDADLRRMVAALRHRGPDADDIWTDPGAGLGIGQARLSVLDHAGGIQPMWSADGEACIVFNGEIYNFAPLRRELESAGRRFNTDHSDTEVVLNAWLTWGERMEERLNGMWAFVVYDRRRRCLFASRDRFGKKPLYYFHDGSRFIFASELGALQRHPACPAEIDLLSIQKYFAHGYIPAPRTHLRGVCKLPAGHQALFELGSGQLRVNRHWRFVQQPKPADPAVAGAELMRRLDEAVQRRLVADVPVGTFLSGGIDSSLVSVLAARHLGAGRLKTFSIGFDETSFDESAHARRVAATIGSDHVEQRLRMDDVLQLVPEVTSRLDEPLADASILPTYAVSRLARREVTVALGGDGADELFAGYGPFLALRWARLLHDVMPAAGVRALRGMAGALPVSHRYMSLDFKIKRALRGIEGDPAFWLPGWMAPMDLAGIARLMPDAAPPQAAAIYSEALDSWNACGVEEDGPRAMQFFVENYLQDGILAKVDRASMMNSLEVRAPFLDIELADFARQLPMDMKLRGSTTKWLLKEEARKLLPDGVATRRKQGFAVPLGRWLQEGSLGIDTAALPGFLDRAEVQRRVQAHRAGRTDERLLLWSIIVLQNVLAAAKGH